MNKNVFGINIKNKKYKLNLFADDLVLYLSKYDISIPKLLEPMTEFSVLSGYKINIDETKIMPINETIKEIPDSLKSFKWSKKGFKYLGCNIRSCETQLYKDNLEALLKDVSTELLEWKSLPLDLMGQINLFRMATLPKLLFTFPIIPIMPPRKFFKTLYQKNNRIYMAEQTHNNKQNYSTVTKSKKWI